MDEVGVGEVFAEEGAVFEAGGHVDDGGVAACAGEGGEVEASEGGGGDAEPERVVGVCGDVVPVGAVGGDAQGVRGAAGALAEAVEGEVGGEVVEVVWFDEELDLVAGAGEVVSVDLSDGAGADDQCAGGSLVHGVVIANGEREEVS